MDAILQRMYDEAICLAEELGKALHEKGLKLAIAESCTGGLIATAITEIPGSSAWFDRGFVTYSNQAKVEMLGVEPNTLAHYGAVSKETAQEMAAGALAHSQSDWSMAITGIAGPDGGCADKPVGTVYIAWQARTGCSNVEKLQLSGNRQQIRAQTASIALSRLLAFCCDSKSPKY